ncbi:hypothetical protein DRN73_01670 [Candidatus Pacearchaeota archaeon]|nr:MAG: hypothetical protein DRN73_01670 [Candidatus Pacearchaeota archaeon]
MPEKILRGIWWNNIPIPDEERVQYFFVILNDSRETRKLISRIVEMFAPVEEFQEHRGVVRGNHYDLVSFYSRRSFENWQKRRIYKGNWKRKERLYERAKEGIEGLENYVISELNK